MPIFLEFTGHFTDTVEFTNPPKINFIATKIQNHSKYSKSNQIICCVFGAETLELDQFFRPNRGIWHLPGRFTATKNSSAFFNDFDTSQKNAERWDAKLPTFQNCQSYKYIWFTWKSLFFDNLFRKSASNSTYKKPKSEYRKFFILFVVIHKDIWRRVMGSYGSKKRITHCLKRSILGEFYTIDYLETIISIIF